MDKETELNNLKIIEEFYDYMYRPPMLSEAIKLGYVTQPHTNAPRRYLEVLVSNYYVKSDFKNPKKSRYAYRVYDCRTGYEFIGSIKEVMGEIRTRRGTIERAAELGLPTHGFMIERRDINSFLKEKERKAHEQEQKTKQEAE